MPTAVDKFIKKFPSWGKHMTALRALVLQQGLEENFKWGLPCYSYEGKNVVILQPFKTTLAMMFFKGSLLKDPQNLLVANGPNSQAARRMEFGPAQNIAKLAPAIKAYLKEAIELEKTGQKVTLKKGAGPLPLELKKMFAQNPKFKQAFSALTPGRQRAYLLHFTSAKQAATRQARIEKCQPWILQGKGLTDR